QTLVALNADFAGSLVFHVREKIAPIREGLALRFTNRRERRNVIARGLLRKRAEPAVLGLPRQLEIESALGTCRMRERDAPGRVLLFAKDLRFDFVLLERLEYRPQILLFGEVGFRVDRQRRVREHLDHAGIAQTPFETPPGELKLVELHQIISQLRAF